MWSCCAVVEQYEQKFAKFPPHKTRTPPNERKERKSPENFTFFLRHANRLFSLSLSLSLSLARAEKEAKKRAEKSHVQRQTQSINRSAYPAHTDLPSQLENLHPPLASFRIGSCYEKKFRPAAVNFVCCTKYTISLLSDLELSSANTGLPRSRSHSGPGDSYLLQ